MGLHIVIGFGSASREAEPLPVYLGYSASAAEAAKKNNTSAVRFEEWHHASGLRKNNPNFTPPGSSPVEAADEAAATASFATEADHGHSRRRR